MMIYTVTAYRWGDKEEHSYIVGVYDDEQLALNAAFTEEQWRGGKYECEVLEWNLTDKPEDDSGAKMPYKFIKRVL